jgi:hypothetical protein
VQLDQGEFVLDSYSILFMPLARCPPACTVLPVEAAETRAECPTSYDAARTPLGATKGRNTETHLQLALDLEGLRHSTAALRSTAGSIL